MELRGVFAITVITEDLPATVAFYGTVLEAEPEFTDDVSAVFRIGGTLLNLLEAVAAPELVAPAGVGERGAGVRAVYTLEVTDVDAEAARLVAAGIPLLNGPIDRPWGPRTLSIQDPVGTVWELAH